MTEKLIKIRKSEDRGSTGALYKEAKDTQDVKLIEEINKILKTRRLNK